MKLPSVSLPVSGSTNPNVNTRRIGKMRRMQSTATIDIVIHVQKSGLWRGNEKAIKHAPQARCL